MLLCRISLLLCVVYINPLRLKEDFLLTDYIRNLLGQLKLKLKRKKLLALDSILKFKTQTHTLNHFDLDPCLTKWTVQQDFWQAKFCIDQFPNCGLLLLSHFHIIFKPTEIIKTLRTFPLSTTLTKHALSVFMIPVKFVAIISG
jgi:hypothetical protein